MNKVNNKNQTIEESIESDSDESINSEELNKLQGELNEAFEKPKIEVEPVKQIEVEPVNEDIPLVKQIEVEPVKQIKEKVKKPTKKQLLEQKKLLEQQLENIEDDEPKEEIKKKGRGRPKKTQEEKLAKKTIIKEKVIYMIPDKETGDYKEVKNAKPLSKRHLKKIEEEKEIQKKEEEIGKRIVRTKTGKEDKRSSKERTPAQIAHSKRLVEMMAKKRAEKKQTANKNMKDTIKQAVVEVVSKPIESVKKELPNYKPPQKNINDQFKDFFG